MKKLLAILLTLILAFASIPAMAEDNVTVMLDGNVIECKDANGNEVPPLLIDGTTYLPVRAIATALDLDIQWDGATSSVFINGVSVLAKKTDVINIFINGAKFTAKDANGNVVNPILQDGTTYLPVRAIGEAFNKEVAWDAATKTVKLTTVAPVEPTVVSIDKNKIYAIVNVASGKALTATNNNTLISEAPVIELKQGFKFVPTNVDGFYFIQSVMTGQNFDVSGHSTVAGGEIITWDPTGADNQMFALKGVENGILIMPYTSGLPLEPTESNTIQTTLDNQDTQKWNLVELDIEAPVSEPTGAYRVFSIGNNALANTDTLTVIAKNNDNNQKWKLTDTGNGEYVITNLATDMSLDVSGQSLNAGDPIITWYTNSDINQRWLLEEQADGTYLIKSAHSGLYLTVSFDNSLVQTYKDSSNANQKWTITTTN